MKTYISIVLVVLLCLVGFAWSENGVGDVESGSADKCISRVDLLEQRVLYLEEQLATVLQMAGYLIFEEGMINGLSGPHVIVEGANFHVRNSAGATDIIDGLGNMVVGYNEPADASPYYRPGSHNLVIGRDHYYESYGGFVAGYHNWIQGPESSISGGNYNSAIGEYSSVSGGGFNRAEGYAASVSGGSFNKASGSVSSIIGGKSNFATGHYSSVSGGIMNNAGGTYSSVSGGSENYAGGTGTNVSGGTVNRAIGALSSVSGGSNRTAPDTYDWAAGELFQDE